MPVKIDRKALAIAASKLRRLRLTDVFERKEHPADTVASVMERGLRDAGSKEALEYILRHGIKYYLEAASERKQNAGA